MNLLDRIKSGSIMMLIPIFFACQKDNGDLELTIEGATDVSFVEFQLPATNLIIDSLRTNHESTVTMGNHQHADFGSVSARAFSHYVYDSGAYIYDTMEFVSMSTQLSISEFISNDPEGRITWTFKFFKDEILSGSQIVYLSDLERVVPGLAMDTLSRVIGETDSVIIINTRLFGERLYTSVVNLDPAALFDFKGNLAFDPADGNQSLISFNLRSTDSRMTLYTRDSRDSVYVTRFRFGGGHYYNVDRNRTGSTIDGLGNLDTLSLTSGSIHLNPVYGIYPLIDIGPLNDYLQVNTNLVINRSNLILDLNPGSSNYVPAISYLYWQPTSGIDGPGLLFDAYNSGLISPQSYLNMLSNPNAQKSLMVTSENEGSYDSDILLFTDDLNNQFSDDFEVDRLVMVSPRVTSIAESLINQNSLRIKLFYTSTK